MTSWDLSYYLLRANYDRVESKYLEGGKLPEVRETDGAIDYRYGCTVTKIEDEGSHVRVVFRRKQEGANDVEESLRTKLLVAADGPSSTIRGMLEPAVERTYAGYCVIRGTVPESQASEAALEVFRERFCFFHAPVRIVQSQLLQARTDFARQMKGDAKSDLHYCWRVRQHRSWSSPAELCLVCELSGRVRGAGEDHDG